MDLQYGTAAGIFHHWWTPHIHHAVDDSDVDLRQASPVTNRPSALLQGDAGTIVGMEYCNIDGSGTDARLGKSRRQRAEVRLHRYGLYLLYERNEYLDTRVRVSLRGTTSWRFDGR